MPILFSAVACDQNVLSKYASCEGNFAEILNEVLLKIPPRNEKMTYFHGHSLLHYILEDKYLYFCITDKTCQRSRAFFFLHEIQRQFKMKQNKDFADVLSSEMYRYNEDYSTIIIRKGELDELNRIGVESSETILGEKILFVNNTENLTYFSTVQCVSPMPEQVVISVQKSNVKLYTIVVAIFAVSLGVAIYVFGPVSCAAILCIFILSYVRSSAKT